MSPSLPARRNPRPTRRKHAARPGKVSPLRADPVRLAAVKAFIAVDRGRPPPEAPPAALADEAQRRLYSQLSSGMVRHKRLLQHEVDRLARGGLGRADRPAVAAAVLGLFQLRFLRGVPAHAAVYESVEVAGRLGCGRAKGWINGILRSAQRELESGGGAVAGLPLAVRTSHPDWMVERWRERYGKAACEAICEANNGYQGVTVRVESAVAGGETEREAVRAELAAEGIAATPHPVLSWALQVERAGALIRSRPFREGLCYVQDAASQLLIAWSAPLWRGWVIDACAAPGGKLTHLLRLAGAPRAVGGPRLLAVDRDRKRLIPLRENLARLRLGQPPLLLADATRLPVRPGAPRAILLDVPCMATGVIRKYPELKWSKRPEDLPRYTALQGELLDEAARVLRPGGHLLYSTCSLEPEENEGQVAAFLARYPRFARVSFATLPAPNTREPVASLVTACGDFQVLPAPHWMGLYGSLLRKGVGDPA